MAAADESDEQRILPKVDVDGEVETEFRVTSDPDSVVVVDAAVVDTAVLVAAAAAAFSASPLAAAKVRFPPVQPRAPGQKARDCVGFGR